MQKSAIAIGGALGAIARYSVGVATAASVGTAFPWGTLAVNVAGAWALGLLMGILPRTTVRPAVRAGLTIGFCGGFTTFSTFAFEIVELARIGHPVLALGYVGASVTIGLLAMAAGLASGVFLSRPHGGWLGRSRQSPAAAQRDPSGDPGLKDEG